MKIDVHWHYMPEEFVQDITCIAYPEQIPIVIAPGAVDHLVLRPGQMGDTVFEPLPSREPAAPRP